MGADAPKSLNMRTNGLPQNAETLYNRDQKLLHGPLADADIFISLQVRGKEVRRLPRAAEADLGQMMTQDRLLLAEAGFCHDSLFEKLKTTHHLAGRPKGDSIGGVHAAAELAASARPKKRHTGEKKK